MTFLQKGLTFTKKLANIISAVSDDPLVKWLRHQPFTLVSWVQIPHGSLFGELAQLGEHLLCKQGVIGSNPFISTNGF